MSVFLAYSLDDTALIPDVLPVGMGRTQGEAAVDAAVRLTMINGLYAINETLVFRQVNLSEDDYNKLREAISSIGLEL